MTNYINQIKFVLLTAILAVIGFGFLSTYRTQVRNQAINDCYTQSFYRLERIEDGKTITTSETQKYIYEQCLLDKRIK